MIPNLRILKAITIITRINNSAEHYNRVLAVFCNVAVISPVTFHVVTASAAANVNLQTHSGKSDKNDSCVRLKFGMAVMQENRSQEGQFLHATIESGDKY